MNPKLLLRHVSIVLLLLSFISLEGKQSEPVELADLEKKYDQAEVYMKAFQIDSANAVLSRLVNQLLDLDQLNTPFGLRVQMRQAEALEKDDQDETAIEELLYVIDASRDKQVWDVNAEAQLSLARLQEKIGRWGQCKEQLAAARQTILTHQLDSIYPRYAIRYASYQRFRGDKDTALFYANEVVRTAPLYGLREHLAVGHLLVGILTKDTDYQQGIYHQKKAGAIWKELGDQVGYGATLSNISKLYLKNNRPKSALMYNDSALMTAKQAAEIGYEGGWIFFVPYKNRAAIYHTLGQVDSAWHYINKGYQLEIADAKKENYQKVVEIDAKYNAAKKEQQLAEQRELLRYEKQRQYWLWGLILLSIIFIFLLTRYYLRLRKANNTAFEQALIIKQANEELSKSLEAQITLQGEVHHRVKNNLQVIISLLELQMEEVKDPQALNSLEAMSNRIYSMAAIHEILYQHQGMELINLKEYTEKLCQHYSNFFDKTQQPVFNLDISDHTFNLATLIPLGVIINELLTNSFKYATQVEEQLKIAIRLKDEKDGYCLSYRDNGPGFPEGVLKQRDGSIGSYLLQSMSRQLKGRFVSKNENGAVVGIFFKEKFG
jgi:two-component sensor histidine kinase